MEIQTNQLYEMKNVISYRAKMTQQEVNDVMNRMGAFIQENRLNKSGCVTTTTFTVENTGGTQLMMCRRDLHSSLNSDFQMRQKLRIRATLLICRKV